MSTDKKVVSMSLTAAEYDRAKRQADRRGVHTFSDYTRAALMSQVNRDERSDRGLRDE